MSIQITKRVWDHSTVHGGELLVLLAIADHADERGWAWPGVESLARKTRQTPRHVTRCLTHLAAVGELNIQLQRGPHGTNRYQVLCFFKPDGLSLNQPKSQDDKPCQGDKCVPQMSPESPEPSSVPTHTMGGTVRGKKVSDWPAEEEVIKHAKTYPGNPAIGVRAGAVSEAWAKNYWSWRTFNAERWPKRWPEELFRRFEREWQEGRPAARGGHKKNARGANGRSVGWQEGDADFWWTDSPAEVRSAINGAALGGDEKTVARLQEILALREKEAR